MSKLKEKIKSAQDIRTELITIPEWDMSIEVRTMRAIDRARVLKNCVDNSGKVIGEKFQAGLVIASCYDPETKERIFDDEDFDLLMEKAAGPVELLAGTAMSLSGLTRDTMTGAEKNS